MTVQELIDNLNAGAMITHTVDHPDHTIGLELANGKRFEITLADLLSLDTETYDTLKNAILRQRREHTV